MPKNFISPLRFPGGKRRLVPEIRSAIDSLGCRPRLYVEPFCGGASVGLQLLGDGSIEYLGLSDADPLIASFWRTAFFDTDWLCGAVEDAEVTVDEWYRYRELAAYEGHLSDRERAITCLFLNRTSFSGILSPVAGPIGGPQQNSHYSIDCRFRKPGVIRRLRRIATLTDRVIFVWNRGWSHTVGHAFALAERRGLGQPFFYLDPPYFEKADRLYRRYFDMNEHMRFRDQVVELDAPWVLSYDNSPHVDELYTRDLRLRKQNVTLTYHHPKRGNHSRATEILMSNTPFLVGADTPAGEADESASDPVDCTGISVSA